MAQKLTPTEKFNILVDAARWEIEHSKDPRTKSRLSGALGLFQVPLKKL